VGLIALLAAACDGKAKKQAVKPAPPDVSVAEVTQSAVPIVMEFSGTIKAKKVVDIIPRVSGYIDKRYFEEGTFVKKGDPLYLIDPRPYKARLDAFNAQLELDQAGLVFWEKEIERYTSLAKQGAASQEKKEGVTAKRDETRAAVQKDKADIENSRLELSYTNITAPFSGRTQQTRINVGQLVHEQRDVLMTLVQMDPIYVMFSMSRRDVFEAQKLQEEGLGFKTWKDFKVELIQPDGSLYAHPGKLNFVSAQIDPATDSLTVRAEFPNPLQQSQEVVLIPGQYVPLRLTVGKNPDALLIPEPALVESQIGSQVYVVGKDNKVESRTVEVGKSYQRQLIINKGLKKGEKVIVEGTQKVRPGVVVKPKPYSAKKASSG
jgi:membrane fusion protein (multidrug efflux system)